MCIDDTWDPIPSADVLTRRMYVRSSGSVQYKISCFVHVCEIPRTGIARVRDHHPSYSIEKVLLVINVGRTRSNVVLSIDIALCANVLPRDIICDIFWFNGQSFASCSIRFRVSLPIPLIRTIVKYVSSIFKSSSSHPTRSQSPSHGLLQVLSIKVSPFFLC